MSPLLLLGLVAAAFALMRRDEVQLDVIPAKAVGLVPRPATVMSCVDTSPYAAEVGRGYGVHEHELHLTLTPLELRQQLADPNVSGLSFVTERRVDRPGEFGTPSPVFSTWHHHRVQLTRAELQQLAATGEVVTQSEAARTSWFELDPRLGPQAAGMGTSPHTHPVRVRCMRR